MFESRANGDTNQLKRRVRRNALWLVALALAFYAGFILLAMRHSLG